MDVTPRCLEPQNHNKVFKGPEDSDMVLCCECNYLYGARSLLAPEAPNCAEAGRLQAACNASVSIQVYEVT